MEPPRENTLDPIASQARSALLAAISRHAETTGKDAPGIKELEQLARAYALVAPPIEQAPGAHAFVPQDRGQGAGEQQTMLMNSIR